MIQLDEYIGGVRGEADDLRFQKSQLVKNGSRGWSRWGSEPMVETTDCWRKDLIVALMNLSESQTLWKQARWFRVEAASVGCLRVVKTGGAADGALVASVVLNPTTANW
jgi:hypothetical protein